MTLHHASPPGTACSDRIYPDLLGPPGPTALELTDRDALLHLLRLSTQRLQRRLLSAPDRVPKLRCGACSTERSGLDAGYRWRLRSTTRTRLAAVGYTTCGGMTDQRLADDRRVEHVNDALRHAQARLPRPRRTSLVELLTLVGPPTPTVSAGRPLAHGRSARRALRPARTGRFRRCRFAPYHRLVRG